MTHAHRVPWRRLGILWLVTALGVASAAEKPLALFQYRYWTSDHGLPHNNVLAIAETGNGFLWFGTPEGLSRFNGAQIEPVPQLRGGSLGVSVSALWADAEGALWVGTVADGLMRLQLHEPNRRWTQTEGLPSNAVLSLRSDGQGRLLVATSEGLARLEGERFVALDGIPRLPFRDLRSAPDGSVWLAAAGRGLYRLPGQAEPPQRIPLPGSARGALEIGRDGTVWAATSDGLWQRSPDGSVRLFGRAEGLASQRIERLLQDRSGALWIAHEGRGVQRLRGERFETFDRPQGLHHGFVHSLFEDRHGALWLGTSLGVGRLRDAAVVTYDRRAGMPAEFIRSVLVDAAGVAWVGSDSGGLTRIEGFDLRHFGPEEGLLGDSVRALAPAPQGGLWIASFDAGLQRFDKGQWRNYGAAEGLPSTIIQALYSEPDGTLWIGTADRGLLRLRNGRFEHRHDLSGGDVRSLLRRRDGTLAVGTASGLALLQDGAIERRLGRRQGLPSEQILTLFEDTASRLWIGTGSGLAVLEGEHIWSAGEVFTRAIYFIIDDDRGGIWISGMHGLAHLPSEGIEPLLRRTGPSRTEALRLVGAGDGLFGAHMVGGTQPAGARGPDGRLWLPTAQGLAVVDPARLSPNPSAPRVQIDAVRVEGRATSFRDGRLQLQAGQSQVEIELGSVHSLGMDRMRYQTLLQGLDPGWRAASAERLVLYAALPPGRYRFRARGVDGDGRVQTEEVALAFDVSARWYQRGLTWVAAGGSLLALLAGIAWLRQQRLLAERARLADEVAARTRELREALAQSQRLMQAKSAFLANMSHELRTPLSAILGYAEQALRQAPEELRPALRKIERNARVQAELVDDVLDASRIDAGRLQVELRSVPLLPLLQGSLDLLMERAETRRLTLQLQPIWPLPTEIPADPLRLQQVVLNLVGNAIKFSQDGEVRIEVGAEPARGVWWFEVIDHGIGIAPEHLARLFQPFEQADPSTSRRFGGSGLGLFISRQLCERMGGSIALSSTPGTGTNARVELPLPLDPRWLHAAPPTAFVEAASGPAPSLEGRVLICDDVADLRELVAAWVEECGAEPLTACDGQVALEQALRSPFELILMDLHMPALDGYQAIARLRAAGYAYPIVVLTADVLGVPPDGADDCIAKPIDRTHLHALLQRFLYPADAATKPPELVGLERNLGERFRSRLRDHAEALRAAAAIPAQLGAALHRLKGSARQFGFPGIGRAAAAAEAALRRGDSLRLGKALERLDRRLRKAAPC